MSSVIPTEPKAQVLIVESRYKVNIVNDITIKRHESSAVQSRNTIKQPQVHVRL